jgi:2'-5' RNA ligase
MLNFNDKVMVALLPGPEWARPDGELSHLTLVYAGKQDDNTLLSLDALSKMALSLALQNSPVVLPVLTKDVFGDGTDDSPKVDVIRFHTTLGLIRMREALQSWNASQHPFTPHMTVGPEGSWQGDLPFSITFDRVAFCNGDQHQEFRMKRSMD